MNFGSEQVCVRTQFQQFFESKRRESPKMSSVCDLDLVVIKKWKNVLFFLNMISLKIHIFKTF